MSFISKKASQFQESVIRQMTQVCLAHNGLNLAQGLPEDQAPPELKQACIEAIQNDYNQYARTWGAPELVEAVAQKYARFQGMQVDPNTMVTICCGTTEAMLSSLLGTINPGDEIIVFLPYYENYLPDTILCGATPRFVNHYRNQDGSYSIDESEFRAAFNNKTRGIILNTPNNPTGKVYSLNELKLFAELCQKYDVLAFMDEIYEHILYDGLEHISLATLDGMSERTITLSGLSKTYSATGWRVAWTVASPLLTQAVRKVHDYVTISAPHPMQQAAVTALNLPSTYYEKLEQLYTHRRELIFNALKKAGFNPTYPQGAYYILVDISPFLKEGESDTEFAFRLVREAGVATVPGSSFYAPPENGRHLLRVSFCKKDETLIKAGEQLFQWSNRR